MTRCLLVLFLFIYSHVCVAKADTAHPPGAAIASASPYATRAGMAVLAEGGNAFDAAVTVTAVLAVTEPYHSGLGGGGFWLLHQAKTKKDSFLDGRERAPLNATPTMYLNQQGKVIEGLSLYGPKAAAIPGEPAAIAYLAKHYGRLPLTRTLAPAIKLAKEGFAVDQHYHDWASRPFLLHQLRRHKTTAAVFLHDNKVPAVGSILKQPALAETLSLLAQKGHKGFYQGEFAKQLVKDVVDAGGIWQEKDLASYQVKIRAPLVGHYQGVNVVTAPPPSAGGLSLLTSLAILKAYPLTELLPVQSIHYTIEAMRLAFWDRTQYLGDPDFIDIPVERLLSDDHIESLRSNIRPDKATPSEQLGLPNYAFAERGFTTTHFSIIDKDGNRVAATMSINFLFGSSFVAKHSGLLLNDEMDDFSIKPGVKNIFGLMGHHSNQIEPGKRPLSSMTPTFLVSKNRVGIIGTPGGSRIPSMVLLATLAFADGKGPLTWASLPRYHHQYLPDRVQFEADALTQRQQDALTAMGYTLNRISRTYGGLSDSYGDMQVVQWNKHDGRLMAVSDPRHVGLAMVAHEEKF